MEVVEVLGAILKIIVDCLLNKLLGASLRVQLLTAGEFDSLIVVFGCIQGISSGAGATNADLLELVGAHHATTAL